jgi:transposase, IS30 family
MAHLTRSRRDQIEALHRARHTQKDIARIVGCHQSTVSREFARSSPGKKRRYAAHSAQRRAEERRSHAYEHRRRWHDQTCLRSHVERELRNKRSPDQIAGRMKQQKRKRRISHQTIYTFIKRDKEDGGDLYRCLRYQGKKYKWRGFVKAIAGIPNRRDISERSPEVNTKERSGDWESDLVASDQSGSGAVATFAERTCIYFQAVLVADKSADEMVRATIDALQHLPPQMRRTMTHDNGREISKHEEITQRLGMTVYCARPYCSWDRPLNEWYNRELRRFFPKGTDFSKKTQVDIDAAVEWLNNCPRRSLNYRTPKEALREKLRIMRFTR